MSAVSLWEIAILMALDRVARDQRLSAVPDGFDLLPVLPDHCRALVALPRRHRDPFDRMLIAQARAERLALLTRDRAIIAYGAAGADVVTFDG
jgi:PIN domain nuclease of toxin-antitoxin system